MTALPPSANSCWFSPLGQYGGTACAEACWCSAAAPHPPLALWTDHSAGRTHASAATHSRTTPAALSIAAGSQQLLSLLQLRRGLSWSCCIVAICIEFALLDMRKERTQLLDVSGNALQQHGSSCTVKGADRWCLTWCHWLSATACPAMAAASALSVGSSSRKSLSDTSRSHPLRRKSCRTHTQTERQVAQGVREHLQVP